MFKIWSGKTGSNRRPQPWQGCALPTELFPHFYRSLTFYNVVCCDGMNCSVVLGGFRKNATFFHLQCLTAGSTGLDSAGGGAAASSSDKGSGTRSSATLRTWSIHLTGMISRPLLTVSGISWRSLTFSSGISTVLMPPRRAASRSEEHTSELQSQSNLVCRLLL